MHCNVTYLESISLSCEIEAGDGEEKVMFPPFADDATFVQPSTVTVAKYKAISLLETSWEKNCKNFRSLGQSWVNRCKHSQNFVIICKILGLLFPCTVWTFALYEDGLDEWCLSGFQFCSTIINIFWNLVPKMIWKVRQC